jgi:hypothetical protein
MYARVENLDGAVEESIEFFRLSGVDGKALASLREAYRQDGYKGFLQTVLGWANAAAQKGYPDMSG